MSFGGAYRTYNPLSLDELRLRSLQRRSEGIRNVDKAFDEAQCRIQEKTESLNALYDERVKRLQEFQKQAEDKVHDYSSIINSKKKVEDRWSNTKTVTSKSKYTSEMDEKPMTRPSKRSEKTIEPKEEKTPKKPEEEEKLKNSRMTEELKEIKEPNNPVEKFDKPKEVEKSPEHQNPPKEEQPRILEEPHEEEKPNEPEKIKEHKESEKTKEPKKQKEPEKTKEPKKPKEPEKLKEPEIQQKPKELDEKTDVQIHKKSSEEKEPNHQDKKPEENANPLPEVVIESTDDNTEASHKDRIDKILECQDVLDPSAKTISPFEQNLIAFGQHFNFIPSPEPEKWESSESEEEQNVEEEYIEEEVELTPYQAALRQKYEEEVSTTKTAAWGGASTVDGKSAKSSLDMSFLNVSPDEEIIHGTLFAQFKEWLISVKEEKDENALKSIKTNQNDPVEEGSRTIDPHPIFKDRSDYIYVGEQNVFRKPHGEGEVNFQNGDFFKGEFLNGARHGVGSLKTAPGTSEIASIEGHYTNDYLEGAAKIVYADGRVRHAFCSKGALHGMSKLFNKDGEIEEMGWYLSGEKEGQFWKFLKGGSYLFGNVTPLGKIGGDDIIYIYPDMKTAIKGTFIDEVLVLGQACYVEDATKKRDLYYIRTTTPKGPVYKYDPGTKNAICKEDPLLPDPYEFNCVYIKQSRMKGAGEGLFSHRDLYKDDVVSFYNGIRMVADELPTNPDEWEKNAYKIMDLLGKNENEKEGVIDIPPEFVSIENYNASLSHKANHSFTPNAKFTLFHHPRFGLIPSIMITSDSVAHDKEITVSYDYAFDESPPWYQDLHTQKMLDTYKESRDFKG